MEKEFDIVFLKPTDFEDCDVCVDYVKKDILVHINLKNLQAKEARRVFDYVSGAVYVKEAQIVDLGDSIFCCIPKMKKIKMDYTNENKAIDDEEIIPFAK